MIKKIDGYLLTSSINHKYIVKVRPFVTAKTDDMYDHIKPTQRNFQPYVYISHLGTNDLQTGMTPEEISEKIITFTKHLVKVIISKHLVKVSFRVVILTKKRQKR